jgi:hypothetical protein
VLGDFLSTLISYDHSDMAILSAHLSCPILCKEIIAVASPSPDNHRSFWNFLGIRNGDCSDTDIEFKCRVNGYG